LKDLGISSKLEERLDEEGLPENPPIDYEFETGMIDTKLSKQHIPLPESKEQLFVMRHILDYEPFPPAATLQSVSALDKFYRDFREPAKKTFPAVPQNYNHKREIAQELTAE
jgi:hypothetical protein